MSCASVAVSLTTIVVRPPAGSVPRLHVTTPDATGQGPPGLAFALTIVNEPSLTCVSVRITSRASDDPRLSTRIVQVAMFPARKGVSGLQSLVTFRSAESSTIVEAVAVLFAGFGSWTLVLATSAVLVIPIGCPAFETVLALTWTLTTTVELAPFRILPNAQVSVPVGPSVQMPRSSVTNSTWGGSLSVTD